MLSPLLAWRFRQGKRENRFISFISGSSMVGIALGCFVLIVILSVMNGFERELKNKILSLVPQGELTAVSSIGFENWQNLLVTFNEDERVKFVQPFSRATGMVQKGRDMKAVEISGIPITSTLPKIYHGLIQPEDWQRLYNDPNGVLLGERILQKLDVDVGDKVQLMLPKLSDDKTLKAPSSVWLTVAGKVTIGGELDSLVGFMHMQTVSEAMILTTGAQGIQFYFHDPFVASELTRRFGYSVQQAAYISDWTRTQGHLYNDIRLVRVVVYVALTLVIAVACFNIVSGLVMAVNEKQSEIAVLKTMGASEGLIMRVFVIQGALNGLIGTSVGTCLGVITALNISHMVDAVENFLGYTLLSGDIYFINFLPSQLNINQVALTAGIAICLSLASTWYPAYRAAKMNPTELLVH